jgi:hypothetical protein
VAKRGHRDNTVERAQEKALRMTSGLKGENYEERCKEAGLETLEERRKTQDMAQVFKILKVLTN